MSIRKLWLIVLTLVATLSIAINALILTSLTDRYFKTYLNETYEEHIDQMITYVAGSLKEETISLRQMAIELESHLDTPIVKIKLYGPQGALLVQVEDRDYDRKDMGRMGMMDFMFRIGEEEVDSFDIIDNGVLLGKLNITKQSSVESSVIAMMFKSRLFINSLISTGFAIVITLLVGAYISKRMSKDLTDTAQFASNIQIGNPIENKPSSIKEINQIQNSLHDLNTRLRLKQKSRKTLIDQLIHQSKTPLTILKSHVEAIEDGVIQISKEELAIFQNQIDHLNNILSNMSTMIDAEKEREILTLETVDIHQLLNQIILGLRSQFDKKGIELKLISTTKVKLMTDPYKLSQVLYNLLTNAYKYTEKGRVEISVKEDKDTLSISITDTGIGIEPSEISNIFNAYYRGASVTKIPGEGIGLYVVKENLNQLNATIEVQSTFGKGSTFTIKLPLRDTQE
ncbi:MAG: sensor histidine kinase [Firmicutes bacterium HGW-Firmicutes-19]|jgi:signal transduction histidine kinase|nr:MAG: sensor histidine kinase [Firmicutes bacterium HGW-Firmicutes-19]